MRRISEISAYTRQAVYRFNVGQALPDAVSCIVMHSMTYIFRVSCIVMHSMTYILYRELPFPIKSTDRKLVVDLVSNSYCRTSRKSINAAGGPGVKWYKLSST
jgi:hypothetical protein